MSKGDSVTIRLRGFPEPLTISATRAGRTVEVDRGDRVTTINEMTRTGKMAGQLLEVATADVVAIHEARVEYRPTAADKRKPVPGQIGLMESINAEAPTIAVDAPPPKPPRRRTRKEELGLGAALQAAERAVQVEAPEQPSDLPPPLDPEDMELDPEPPVIPALYDLDEEDPGPPVEPPPLCGLTAPWGVACDLPWGHPGVGHNWPMGAEQ